MLLSRRRPDTDASTRRPSGALAEVHQLPPRPSPVNGANVASWPGRKTSLLAATAGRIIADGSLEEPESGDECRDDDGGDEDHDDAETKTTSSSSGRGGHNSDAHGATKRSKRRRRRPPRQPSKPCARCAAINFPRLLDWKPDQPRPWTSLAHVFLSPLPLPPSPPPSTCGTPKSAHSPMPSPSPSSSSFSASSLAPSHASSSSRSASSVSSYSRSPSCASSCPRSPSHAPAPPPPTCPYCTFFQVVLGPGADVALGGKFTPYLRIRQAFERLQGVSERHELAHSVLAEVTTRNRALPWGFLVKAIDGGSGSAGDRADIRAYRADEGTPARIRGRVVTPMLDPALARCWLDFCKDAHATSCGAAEAPIPGLRLIDCRERRIICADNLEAQTPLEYVALSYVWGTAAEWTSSLKDCPPDPGGQPLPDEMPAVFADAVSLTKSLGLRYLWIDRFCFSPLDAAERKRQAGFLGDIFSKATLTIVAASGEGVQDGMAGVSVARQCHQLSLKTERGLFTTTLLRSDVEVASSRWASRAWTYQEGLLSRRRLVLGPSQAYYQCRALHCHESVALPLRLAPGVNLGRVFPSDDAARRPARLREHIESFMARDMARTEDRLDAFRGVLRSFSRIVGLPVDHFLGLPLFHPDALINVPLGHSVSGRIFHFNLVGEASPIIDGACSAPRMEISVGFADGTVLSWEIDGDAVAKKTQPVAFVRLETYSTELRLKLESRSWVVETAGSAAETPLSPHHRHAIEAWVRASPPPSPPPSSSVEDPSAIVTGIRPSPWCASAP
ncbi:hypothetical protein HIM_06384 [Hirsutella minnesotensis 3608]|uniref:Heterokaryon incompatibility domain-containing protein n=1 Tax=Hirsutella minnesotensis 3608 TaxID=1043627 RepID=A0A0F7ZU31_9HYPO|nr:hypothetical protein HIM_06384 [Hirsutella minnesotensis 3608]